MRVVGVAPFSQSRHERDRQPPFHLKRSDRREIGVGFGKTKIRHKLSFIS